MTDTELAEKYLALWNEPDADRRRQTIAELWTEDGRHILQPPQEIRAIAAQPGIGLPAILEARGHEQIAARAASAYDHWVGSEGLSFRGRDDVDRLGDVVKFHWEAVARTATVRGRARLPRPRRGRPDRARLHLRRRLGGMGAWREEFGRQQVGEPAPVLVGRPAELNRE